MSLRLLLISNSTCHGRGYLDHCAEEIVEFLGDRRRFAFVPFALFDREGYGRAVETRLAGLGIETTTVTPDERGRRVVGEADSVFVGGGNTFRLVDTLQQSGLLETIRARVREGLPYMGSSAGTNIAAPTIKTTNDMPIVQPGSFEALDLLPFQINPHYLDADPSSVHMGETREQRLVEYLEENEMPVVGLREGAWIRVEGPHATLGGDRGARIFRRGQTPEEREPGGTLDDLWP